MKQMFLFMLLSGLVFFLLLFLMTRDYVRTSSNLKPAYPSPLEPLMNKIQKRMEDRVARLKRVCKEMPDDSKETKALAEGPRYMKHVLEEHKLMVCVVHKAGSTTWNYMVAKRYNNTKILGNKKFYRMVELLKPTKKRFNEVLTSPDFLRIIMARHPLERLLSGFQNRIEDTNVVSGQAKRYVPLILRHSRANNSYSREDIFHRNGKLRIVPTFQEFVSYLVTEPPHTYDPHFLPVSVQCDPCHINYNAIMLTETLTEDLQYIIWSSGMEKWIDPSFLMKKYNKRGGDTQKILVDYYSTLEPSLLHEIMEIYKNDLTMFNYTTHDLLRRINITRHQGKENLS